MNQQRITTLSRWLAIAATAIAALSLLWPVLGSPTTDAIGLADGEGPAHLWGLWVSAEGLLSHGPFLRVSPVNHPAGFEADLMDPINLALFLPGWLLGGRGAAGAVLGWNVIHLLTVVVAGWGGWRLGRKLLESPQAAAVVAASVAAAPYLIGAVGVVGRSEYLPMAGWALHLSFLAGSLRPEPARREQLGAILTLVALAHAGWQPLTWLIFAELAVVWLLCREQPRRDTLTRLAVVVVPAVLLTLPMLLSHLGTDPWWLERLDRPSPFDKRPRAVPLAALLPIIDTTRSWANSPLPYLGLALPLTAFAGAIGSRAARKWLVLAMVVLVFAMGELVALGTSNQSSMGFFFMPAAALMHIFAPLRAFHGWARLTLLVVPLLAICAGHAIDRLATTNPRHALRTAAFLVLVLLVEGMTWAPVGRGCFEIGVDPALATALATLPDGPILELPLGLDQADADRALLRSHQLHRPTSLAPSPHQPSAMILSATAWSIEQGTALASHRCAASERTRLVEAGFVGVVVHGDLLPEGSTAMHDITGLLGEPLTWAGQTAIWRLSAEGGIPHGCQELDALTLKR